MRRRQIVLLVLLVVIVGVVGAAMLADAQTDPRELPCELETSFNASVDFVGSFDTAEDAAKALIEATAGSIEGKPSVSDFTYVQIEDTSLPKSSQKFAAQVDGQTKAIATVTQLDDGSWLGEGVVGCMA